MAMTKAPIAKRSGLDGRRADGRQDHAEEEARGLLTKRKEEEEEEDDDDNDDNADRHDLLAGADGSADDKVDEAAKTLLSTPRTLHRVRFDLPPESRDASTERRSPPPAYQDSPAQPLLTADGDGDGDGDAHSVRLTAVRGGGSRHGHQGHDAYDGDDDNDGALAHAEEEYRRPRSNLRSAFTNMANSILGAGIIGQPYALRQAGLAAGVALLVALGLLVDWTIRLIVVNSKLSGRRSFQGTVEYCFGWWGLVAISLAQWAVAFGGMVALCVIIGDSIPQVLRALWPGLEDVPVLGLLGNRRVVIFVFVMGVSWPLSLYRHISKLAKASTAALVGMLVILLTVVVQAFFVPAASRGEFSTPTLTINSGIFQAVGVISFAFVCHHNTMFIYDSMHTPTLDRFSRVTHYSTGISMVACLAMGLAGFLTFGSLTQGNVLNNYTETNTMANIARLCFGLNMLTTLPLEAFVCREVIINYFHGGETPPPPSSSSSSSSEARSSSSDLTRHFLYSTGLVASAMLLGLLTCDLGVIFELIGATSACALAYILPPLCYLRLTKQRSWKTYGAGATVAFGVFVSLVSLVQTLIKVWTGEGGSAQCR